MKNVLLVVNALLVLAVGYLLYKQVGGNKNSSAVTAQSVVNKDSALHKKMLFAYINTDSIQEKYQLAKEVKDEVERKNTSLNAELEKMEKSYRNKLESYQKQGPTMTEAQANAARQDMEATQSQMMERGQSLREEFNQYVSSKNLSVIKDIQDYLKKFNADGTYSFIFSYEPALFYYKDTTYDITAAVLKGLNEEYKSKKRQ